MARKKKISQTKTVEVAAVGKAVTETAAKAEKVVKEIKENRSYEMGNWIIICLVREPIMNCTEN